jgi:class 3 adenylate cyclase
MPTLTKRIYAREVAPKTRYARNGGVSLAYQVFGEGDFDLLLITGWIPSMEAFWMDPLHARFYERLGSFARVICMDKRGTGLSDRVPPDSLPPLEERMDDIGVVMDAAGSERAALFGLSEGASLCLLFAATYPERTRALVSYGGFPRQLYDEDMPWQPEREAFEEFVEGVELSWDEAGGLLRLWAPGVSDDPVEQERFAHALQSGASPSAAAAWLRMLGQTDIRDVLPTISAPTLILHRAGDGLIVPENSRYMAERIPGARYVELAGGDHLWWYGDQDALLDEVEQFLTGQRPVVEPDRVLATVLFTDIVGSTERAAAVGDAEWRRLVERHDELVRTELARHRGEEVKTMGDGFLATFDGPARGIRCAAAARDAVRSLGIEIRAGLHTGECERMNGDIGGIAVAIGARIGSLAGTGEVLVSSTVKDLVAGSGIEFADRGAHQLKGVPGEWRLFAADPGS